ncbi:acyl-CoA desaturase [Mameliella alba]|uniref:acyl-CoA desaturase n=1 Tax=Mameliella alba TaxID=561184 RepID=UPI0021BD5514|nr:acyl-CoA desaturase [Mameliella alba]
MTMTLAARAVARNAVRNAPGFPLRPDGPDRRSAESRTCLANRPGPILRQTHQKVQVAMFHATQGPAVGASPAPRIEVVASERVRPLPGTDPCAGRIHWAPGKSAWWFAHALGGVLAVTAFPSWSGLAVFLVLTGITICAGHSVGMHRLLIHRSFETSKPVEYLLVWLGVLVGMAGPFGMIRAHDMRDWHQRQANCPPHPSHGAGPLKDAWWQMHCEFRLAHPPVFEIEPEIAQDPVYRWMERLWWAQQLPVALALFALGGWGWVLWGVSLRIVVSLTGHWAIGHAAHKGGQQDWTIDGLPVQGYNLPGFGPITFGENWHGNHHAFPHSARLGVLPGQSDPGFRLIQALDWLGLASGIRLPHSAPPRPGLRRLD